MTDENLSAAAAAPARKNGKYSAVVYVHGIGSQRRYEETSRLIDQLDEFSRADPGDSPPPGNLSGIKAQVEPLGEGCGGEPGEVVGFIDTTYAGGAPVRRRHVRFYEAYWAPVMADVTSTRGVLSWLFRQPIRPWRTLLSPWRERQRLRRSRLVSLFERRQRIGQPADDEAHDDFQDLLKAYRDFERLDNQDDYPKGSFGEFLKFINAEHTEPARRERLRTVARAWRRGYVVDELRNMFILWTMALFLVLVGAAAVGLAFMLLRWGAGLLPGIADEPIKPATAASLAAAIAGGLGLTKALNDYLGDVQAWATYQETDVKNAARNETLERCMTLLTHVLGDKNCERVTIVAHSLGTSIAHDALLALRRRNSAISGKTVMDTPVPLRKIEHLVTLGSPIDKIEYFFESYASYSHRYKRVTEQFRGDISQPPFTDGGRPHIHWINYWDTADIISGALHSPAGEQVHLQRIDNVQVASLAFPAVGASHSGYFTHRRVMGDLFDIIFHRRWSFVAEPKVDPRTLFLDPGPVFDPRVLVQVAVLLIPWIILASLATRIDLWGRILAGVAWLCTLVRSWRSDVFIGRMGEILAAKTPQDEALRTGWAIGVVLVLLLAYWWLGKRQRSPIPPRVAWRKRKAAGRTGSATTNDPGA